MLRVDLGELADNPDDESLMNCVDASLYCSRDMQAGATPIGEHKLTLEQQDNTAGEGNNEDVF